MAAEDLGDDLRYAFGAPGEEPHPVLNTNEAVFYTAWLRAHGYITSEEKRVLLAEIRRVRNALDEAADWPEDEGDA